MKEYVGIYIKTEKAQEQDWDGALLWIKINWSKIINIQNTRVYLNSK